MRYYQDHRSSLLLDVFGMLAFLGLGIAGQIFLLNPIGILTPDLPMLTREMLPNSASTFVYESHQFGPPSENRAFDITLTRGHGERWLSNEGAEVSQKVFWYAKPEEAVLAWQRSELEVKDDFSNIPPVISKHLDENSPAFSLYCSDEPNNRRICAYLSYWKHWYTEIWFWSGGDNYLSLAEVQKLSFQATELLVAAPDQP